MDFGFRELLVLTGVALLGYLVWDGWRNRSRDQYKFKLEKNIPPEPETRPVKEGIDRDGIGQVRVKTPITEATFESSHESEPDTMPDVSTPRAASTHVEPVFGDEPTVRQDPELPIGNTGELFADSMVPVKNKNKAKQNKQAAPSKAAEPVEPEFQVISLTVHAPEGKLFDGSELSIAMMEASLVFGEMDIFHRHLDGTPHSEIQFSVVNAIKPGTFDPNNLESFSTPGISLFMQMPGPKDPRLAYQLMTSAAEQIARSLGGTILDGTRQQFGAESRRAHESQISQFELKQTAKA